jgi:small ligand-binding sensory domain FIST
VSVVTARAGSGLAVSPDLEDAALDAALGALSSGGLDRADLAFVFVSGDASDRAPQVLHAVRRVSGAPAVIGCSGTGVLTERGEVEGRAAVAVLAVRSERLIATPVLIDEGETIGAGAGKELARRSAETLLEGGSFVILPGVDGLDPGALLGTLDDAIGFVPVVGAAAAGMLPVALLNADVVGRGLSALALSGATLEVGVAQGCMPIGEPYVITSAEGHVVRTIGSRPALRVLKDSIDTLPNAEERIQRVGVFAGLAIDPAKSPLERGDFLVRNLVAIDETSGALALAEPVRVGQTIQFQIRDTEAAREDLVATLDALAARLDESRPAFGCYFNCAGRGRGLFGVPDHDLRLIRARFGRFPLAGVFGNGEFAPVGGKNFFHAYTGVLALYR